MRPAPSFAGFAIACTCIAIVHAGCGEARPPLLGSEFGPASQSGATGDGGGDGASPTLDFDSGTGPICPKSADGGTCGCLDLPLLGDAPNLYFVLDRSGSMTDSNKWDTIRIVVTEVMRKLGPRGRFGAAVFPDPRQDQCAPGIEVMAPMLGDVPAGTYGATTSTFNLSTKFVASGGTPTAGTLAALRNRLTSLPGKTFVILATDGGPNCDDKVTCTVDQCIPNIEGAPGCTAGAPPNCCDGNPESCLDGAAAVTAVKELSVAGIPTYVVGVPGSAPYANVLSDMAEAGGTQRYYDVTSADQSAFAAALTQIAAKITATCTFSLGQTPPDPNMVNVYLDDTVLPRDPNNGWRLDGETVTILGSACQDIQSGKVLEVRIVAGCPTVVN